ncbi:MAG: ribulose-phosphate 3-epimerase [Wujia sp.]
MNILSPSLLSIDFNHVERNAKVLDAAGVKWFHLDVMDGIFVKNISFGPPVIKCIRKITDSFFDVHLMIVDPIRYVDAFKDAGADMLTVHYEACQNLQETIDYIKDAEMKVGVAINPETPVSVLEEYIDKVDMILIMSVKPGFGGQKFMPIALDKLKVIREWADKVNPELKIQVDGGITLDNVQSVLDAGANVVVAGSAIFRGDKAENVRAFQEALGNS